MRNSTGATYGAGSANSSGAPEITPYFGGVRVVCDILFRHCCQYNGIWFDCRTSERLNAIKPGSIYHFLHKRMPVPSQEYDSWYPFVWCVWAFDFAIWLGIFRFEFSSKFSIFVILLIIKDIQTVQNLENMAKMCFLLQEAR